MLNFKGLEPPTSSPKFENPKNDHFPYFQTTFDHLKPKTKIFLRKLTFLALRNCPECKGNPVDGT